MALCAVSCLAQMSTNEMPIKGLRVPLEYYTNGNVKCHILAAAARMPDGGDVRASDVRVEFFRPDGSVEAFMAAEDCVYAKEKKLVTSSSKVRVERGNLLITGKGFEWSADAQRVRILADVRVEFSRDALDGDLKGGLLGGRLDGRGEQGRDEPPDRMEE